MTRPPNPDKAIKQSISVKPDLLPILVQYCQKEERSMSWVINKALRQYLHVEEIK
jgi:predicted transcriptional regulator